MRVVPDQDYHPGGASVPHDFDAWAQLRRFIDLDAHHPRIVVWTVINESWGIDLADAGVHGCVRSSTTSRSTRRAPWSWLRGAATSAALA